MEKKAWVYILRCADGTFYTGWTYDLQVRVAAHNSGKGSRYVLPRCPAVLVYQEPVPSKREALRRELAIKKMTRESKERLVQGQAGDPPVPEE